MSQLQTVIGTTVLVIGVVASSWLAVKNSTLAAIPKGLKFQTGVAYNINVTKMNKVGLPSYRAHINQATQYNDGSSTFEHINATVISYNQSPSWALYADKGSANSTNTKLNVWGHVKADRPAEPDYPPISFRTHSLTMYPAKHRIDTNDPVRFFQPGSQNQTQGVGMTVNTKANTARILSQVYSTYETHNASNTTGHR